MAPASVSGCQTLYQNRLCKCKPRKFVGEGKDTDSRTASTGDAFSELLTLCKTWEREPPMASLALEGALCCLRWLKALGNDGASASPALDASLQGLCSAVADFFAKKRGGGLTSTQVLVVGTSGVSCAFKGRLRRLCRNHTRRNSVMGLRIVLSLNTSTPACECVGVCIKVLCECTVVRVSKMSGTPMTVYRRA